jgi:hypothetical protein
MPRPIPALQADIDKLEEMRKSHNVSDGEDFRLSSLIDETIARLEGEIRDIKDRKAARRAERHAALDDEQDKVDAMLLEPDLSQYVQNRLNRFKERIEQYRSHLP